MIKILHIIDFLCLGGAARSMIAISKYSSRLDNQLRHQVISLEETLLCSQFIYKGNFWKQCFLW